MEARIKGEFEQKTRDEEQRRLKRQWMEGQYREAIKKRRQQAIEEQLQRVKALEFQLDEARRKREELERMWDETQKDEVWKEQDGLSQGYGEKEPEKISEDSPKDPQVKR